MTHASLFSGIGGFDLAAEWMGWENAFHCEINPFCQQVLHNDYPNAIGYEDITKTDFSIWRNRIDILTGGFPCQPYSTAGKQLGTEDDRHLWPEMLRAIREISPRWIVGENVNGLVSWNGGLVFEQVQAELEAEGYQVQPVILPAGGVGAPHRRYRVWFIAHRADTGAEGVRPEWKDTIHGFEAATDSGCGTGGRRQDKPAEHFHNRKDGGREEAANQSGGLSGARAASDAYQLNGDSSGLYTSWGSQQQAPRIQQHYVADALCTRCEEFNAATLANEPGFGARGAPPDWRDFPTQSPVCAGDDGFPTDALRQRIREDCLGFISEKEIDKILSKAYVEWRRESIKAGGNAIVPQVVLQIFQAIAAYIKASAGITA